MNPEQGRQPGANPPAGPQQGWQPQPGYQQPQQPPAYGPPPGYEQPPAYGPPPGYPAQPGFQAQPGQQPQEPGQWQAPVPPQGVPPQGGAPQGKPKWLLPVLGLVGILVIVGGVFGGIALFGGDDSGGSSGSAASESQFTAASDPTEALIAATNVTLDSSPMVTHMSESGTPVSITKSDHASGITYSEISGGATPGATFYVSGDEMLIKFGPEMGLPGVDGDTWYRLGTDNPLFAMLGQTFASLADRDAQLEMMDVYSSVEDKGKSTFEGQSLTRLVATVDPEKFVEYSLNIAKDFGGAELGISDADMRRQMQSMVPATVEYWVDDRGRIIKQVTGGQVMVNSKFGEPLDIPEISESEIEEFPFD